MYIPPLLDVTAKNSPLDKKRCLWTTARDKIKHLNLSRADTCVCHSVEVVGNEMIFRSDSGKLRRGEREGKGYISADFEKFSFD
ncbi:hypothetical protein Bpfe_020089 [Biomphalaria pfeifferi]|uniref:Uncharacterized protein n=1 Tax=Biomphalaria pfeifferi TaxID=112525 RepID=A0AAD8B9T2_BIOPF|nr:hypothetical protein Bpfe_020089 [Biomphalaria pfeifferi]